MSFESLKFYLHSIANYQNELPSNILLTGCLKFINEAFDVPIFKTFFDKNTENLLFDVLLPLIKTNK